MDKGKVVKKKHGRGFLAAAIVTVAVLLACILCVTLFQIKDIEVVGNSHYTDAEIENFILSDSYSSNSLYLYVKYNYLGGEEIPFVDKLEVSLKSPGEVRVRVYEKSIVGYVSYMGANFYFDQDGTIVESSTETTEGIPCISGLKFSSIAMYQKLEVEDDSVFEQIMTVTQMLEKYDLKPDRIEFSSDLELTLYFGDLRAALGSSGDLEDKIGRFAQLWPDLEGRAGVLRMENYTGDSRYISFEKDTN